MSKAKVELHQAFEWTCDACGRNNFESAIACELTPAQRREMLKQVPAGDEEGRSYVLRGEFITCPEEVECKHCGACFDAADPE